jgi:flagellar biogenesis protein FliO
MRRIIPHLALLLGLFCVAEASAQRIAYPPTRSPFHSDVEAVAYQQPVSDARNPGGESQQLRPYSLDNASAVPLKPPPAEHADGEKKPEGYRTLTTMIGALAVALGLFFLVAWLLKKTAGQRLGMLPTEVVEVLGRTMLANHQQAQLIRCGNKLLLVANATAAGATARTLTEIADPDEVERLTGFCRQMRSAPTTKSLRQVFRRLETRDE